ncbi:hypothetical protein [Streptomyces sp. SCSIO ZS0520]|uniref:hypothetical protein n=1 Tax=Streptomyces sp. SCSIO ZS0520 TaxID=2892996 RepID=UPI0021DA000F|nr:hypothetical protein [Streptomyces sp. SCSIO ZS0520]
MTTPCLVLGLLAAAQVSGLLLARTVSAATAVVLARRALHGAEPRHRAAILRALAEIVRALREPGR